MNTIMNKLGIVVGVNTSKIISKHVIPLVSRNQVLRISSFSTISSSVNTKSLLKPFKATIHNIKTISSGSESCWKCKEEYDVCVSGSVCLNCPKCNSLRKIDAKNMPNYYDLLNIPRTYQVDITDLTKRAKRLQKKLHPDLFSQSGEEEQEISQQMSSLVNKAQSTLSNPIERGYYLLKLSGMDISNDMEKQTTTDPEFLGEVMELNEKLVEISSEKEWRNFRDQNEIQLKNLQKDLEEAFKQKKLEEAKLVIARMKYFDSLQMKLKDLQSKIGIVE